MPQGNINNEEWVRARKNQCRQMMVMLGCISKKDLLKEYDVIPSYFDPTQLPTLNPNQIVWWDETHIRQEAGIVTTDGYQIRLARDKDGKYDPNGTYTEESKRPTFKYTEEARFCLGVASVKVNGKEIGKRCKSFDYTGEKIVSIHDMEQMIEKEIFRVRNLKCSSTKSPWIINPYPKNVLYIY